MFETAEKGLGKDVKHASIHEQGGAHPKKRLRDLVRTVFLGKKALVFSSLFYSETSVSVEISKKPFSDHQCDRGWK